MARGTAAALAEQQKKVADLIATRTKQQRIVRECTKKLEEITKLYANKTGKKPAQFHTLHGKIAKAKQIMLGSFNDAVEMLSAADAAAAADAPAAGLGLAGWRLGLLGGLGGHAAIQSRSNSSDTWLGLG